MVSYWNMLLQWNFFLHIGEIERGLNGLSFIARVDSTISDLRFWCSSFQIVMQLIHHLSYFSQMTTAHQCKTCWSLNNFYMAVSRYFFRTGKTVLFKSYTDTDTTNKILRLLSSFPFLLFSLYFRSPHIYDNRFANLFWVTSKGYITWSQSQSKGHLMAFLPPSVFNVLNCYQMVRSSSKNVVRCKLIDGWITIHSLPFQRTWHSVIVEKW